LGSRGKIPRNLGIENMYRNRQWMLTESTKETQAAKSEKHELVWKNSLPSGMRQQSKIFNVLFAERN
jgi:hypothetical protein